MELIPVDPNSDISKEILAVHGASQNMNPKGETRQLIPVDPRSQIGQEVLTMATKQAGAELEKTKPQRGEPLNVEPIVPARPMGGVESLDIEHYAKTGEKKMTPKSTSGSYGPAAAILSPASRIPAAATGAITSAAEDIGQGKMPSIPGMIVGGIGGAISPEIAKTLKAGYRGAASLFGRGPLKEAGNVVMDATKGLTKTTGTQATESELMSQLQSWGRTAPAESKKVVTDVFDKVVGSKAAGKPLSYGEVFDNATQVNQAAHDLYKAGNTKAGKQLDKLHESMMNDLAASGPEAAQAVQQYKRAIGAFGGYGGVVQAIKKISGVGTGGAALVAAALKPGTAYVSAPIALLSGIANLSTRLPGGVGQGIAQALIRDPGSISLGAARALADSINSAGKQGLEY